MIRAKFIGGRKLQDGRITYTLTAPGRTRAEQIAAMEYEEAPEVEIRLPDQSVGTGKFESMEDIIPEIMRLAAKLQAGLSEKREGGGDERIDGSLNL